MKMKMITAVILLSASQVGIANTSPTIQLFPTQVRADIQAAGEASKTLQSEVSTLGQSLAEQAKLYQASLCDTSSADAGCEAIKQQMFAKRDEMNETVRGLLPETKRAIKRARSGLARNLAKFSQRNTPEDIQKKLLSQKKGSQHKRFKGKTSIGKLANQLVKINAMISVPGQNVSMIAANSYYDLKQLEAEIKVMEQQVQNNEVEAVFREMWGGSISDETVAGAVEANGILYGEDESGVMSYSEPVVEQDEYSRNMGAYSNLSF
jgi:hypothetical protein